MRISRLVPAAAAAAACVLALFAPSASAAPEAPLQDAPPPTTQIIGGGYAQNAPWAARLFSNGRETCSATIIAPTWILTAKHCVTGGGLSFRIGSLDQHSGGVVANGAQTYTHSSDLALVRLDRSVQATYSRLGSPGSVSVGQNVQVWGWGATSQCGSEANCQSRYLKVANVTVTGGCGDAYGGSAICARRGNGITAGGDSGGPMTANGIQVGVASTSDRQTTTAYTNVTAYRSWIQSIAGV
ncbi:S1 family peptidase [Streptomyces anulatus]|uniref:S1 family peptidase n=1 Tax=Streptomyces anulatus TaxID=1892 RepID=UPI001C267C91|nr:trypsin-like serine protease [Streptomyces anulatus]